MKRRVFSGLVGALAAAILALPVTGSITYAGMAEDEAAIRDIWATYAATRVTGDAEAWLALWDEGGIQMPPGIPARGKDELKVGVPRAFAAGGVNSMSIEPVEIVVAADWAYSRGTYSSERVVDGITVLVEGKFMTIFKRQDDGSWKIFRDIFNSNK